MTFAPPRVSVIVPCHNLGGYLGDAVDSVLAQSFTEVEVIVVDDGSTDPATSAILDHLSRPRTQVLRRAHGGAAAAKNAGLASARGELVCVLDADDRLEPEMLALSIEALDQRPDVTFATHWVRAFGDESWEWAPTDCGFPTLLDRNTVSRSALVRKSALAAVGGFDEAFDQGGEDWDAWVSLVAAGHNGVILERCLMAHRRHAASASRQRDDDHHASVFQRLVSKHTALYRRHLRTLVVRREVEEARLRTLDLDLARNRAVRTVPALLRLEADARDLNDAKGVERRVAADSPGRVDSAAASGASDETSTERDAALLLAQQLALDCQRAVQERDAALARSAAAEQSAKKAMRAVDAVRGSVTWRMARWLRGAFAFLHPERAAR